MENQPYWYGGALSVLGIVSSAVGLYYYTRRKGSAQEQIDAKALREESDFAVQQARAALTRALDEIKSRDERITRLEEKHAAEVAKTEADHCRELTACEGRLEASDGRHNSCEIARATLLAYLETMVALAKQRRVQVPRAIEALLSGGSGPHSPLPKPDGQQ